MRGCCSLHLAPLVDLAARLGRSESGVVTACFLSSIINIIGYTVEKSSPHFRNGNEIGYNYYRLSHEEQGNSVKCATANTRRRTYARRVFAFWGCKGLYLGRLKQVGVGRQTRAQSRLTRFTGFLLGVVSSGWDPFSLGDPGRVMPVNLGRHGTGRPSKLMQGFELF